MKRLSMFVLLLLMGAFLFRCAGPKKLTPEEYDQLSSQEKIVYLEKQVKKNPADLTLKKMLYKEYLNNNMSDRALGVMKEILAQDPNDAEVQFDLGELMMQRGEQRLAYAAFRNVLQSPSGVAYKSRIGKYLGGKYLIQRITESEADEAFPSFSADGKKIVYQTNVNGNWDIVEKNLETGETRFLVNTPADEELPCYSPTQNLLLYTSNADDKRPIDSKFKVREIYLLNLDNGYSRNLTESVADDWLPRFSHDGKYITFVSERSDLRSVPYTEKKSDIYIMEWDGDFQLRLTPGEYNDGGACFSMDDQHIFFHSNRNGSYDIFIMKTDGTKEMTVLGDPEANEVNPFACPDSQHIVYFSDKNGNYDIFRAKVDGSEVEQLTFNPAMDLNPVVSPDGKTIAFHSNRYGNFDIFLINLEANAEPTIDDMLTQINSYLNQKQ